MVTKGPAGLDIMYGARDHFLARTGFAEQQDGPAATSELFHHP